MDLLGSCRVPLRSLFTMKVKKDFHIHSCYSRDGHLSPETIITLALKRGLRTIAITDHDTIAGGIAVRKYAPEELQVIVGAEIYTDKGEVTGLELHEEITSRGLREVVREIHEQGGKVCVPHPFDRLRKSALRDDIYSVIPEIDFIETFNGRSFFQADNVKARKFAEQHAIPELRGSDAHYAFEMGNLQPGLKAFLIAGVAHALTVTTKYTQRLIKKNSIGERGSHGK